MAGSAEHGLVTGRPTGRQTGRPGDVLAVTRVGETTWILRPRESLEGRVVATLRDAFSRAVDSGARDVVVDLSEVRAITADGAAALVAMADLLADRDGSFWVGARAAGGAHTLRQVDAGAPRALLGATPELDAALEHLPARTS